MVPVNVPPPVLDEESWDPAWTVTSEPSGLVRVMSRSTVWVMVRGTPLEKVTDSDVDHDTALVVSGSEVVEGSSDVVEGASEVMEEGLAEVVDEGSEEVV